MTLTMVTSILLTDIQPPEISQSIITTLALVTKVEPSRHIKDGSR